jgi:hypothetical protein
MAQCKCGEVIPMTSDIDGEIDILCQYCYLSEIEADIDAHEASILRENEMLYEAESDRGLRK